MNLEKAVMRELKEETGSDNYKIIMKFDKKICFEFLKPHRYDRQETVMFYVEYLGDSTDLKPQDDEIDAVKFYGRNEVISIISLEETRRFLEEVRW
jgi:putative (di)nucleoside polyphosphate hydrolase